MRMNLEIKFLLMLRYIGMSRIVDARDRSNAKHEENIEAFFFCVGSLTLKKTCLRRHQHNLKRKRKIAVTIRTKKWENGKKENSAV